MSEPIGLGEIREKIKNSRIRLVEVVERRWVGCMEVLSGRVVGIVRLSERLCDLIMGARSRGGNYSRVG